MAQAANITLNSVVYSPRGTTGGITTWSSPVGEHGERSLLTESVRGPLDNNMYRGRIVLDMPEVREADSACGCAGSILGVAKANTTLDIPSTFSPAQRADFLARYRAFVASAYFADIVNNFEGAWG